MIRANSYAILNWAVERWADKIKIPKSYKDPWDHGGWIPGEADILSDFLMAMLNHYGAFYDRALISEVILCGIKLGYSRAYKHTDNPGDRAIRASVLDNVVNEICMYYKIEDEE